MSTLNNINYKTEYDKTLASGMFFEFHPELSGVWEKDKKAYTKTVKANKKKANVN